MYVIAAMHSLKAIHVHLEWYLEVLVLLMKLLHINAQLAIHFLVPPVSDRLIYQAIDAQVLERLMAICARILIMLYQFILV